MLSRCHQLFIFLGGYFRSSTIVYDRWSRYADYFQCVDWVSGFVNRHRGQLLTRNRCSAVYAQTGNDGAGKAVIAMIFLFYGVAGFAWPGLTVAYPAEILPFSIRAKGLAVTMAVTSLSSVFNQYVNPVGLEALQWRFYFVYITILVVECLCIWFLFVETKGPTLEEIAALFDGEHANVAGNERLELQRETKSMEP